MGFKVVGLGEVLWDLLDSGPQLGGAPANFAYHSRALGADAWVITRVGSDDYGREVIRRFRAMELPTQTVQVDETAPTGTAKVELSGKGLAHFTITEDVAWDRLGLTDEALFCVSSADAICFGSLAQRKDSAREAIEQLVLATPAKALRVFDINLRQQFYSPAIIEQSLRSANLLKLNDDELPVLSAMFSFSGSVKQQIEHLARRFDLRLVAFTRGADGSLLFERQRDGQRWSECRSVPLNVVDTVGAGDSFTAALVIGLLSKMDLDEINSAANDVARYVCSHAGATPVMPDEFARRFSVPM